MADKLRQDPAIAEPNDKVNLRLNLLNNGRTIYARTSPQNYGWLVNETLGSIADLLGSPEKFEEFSSKLKKAIARDKRGPRG